MIRFVDRMSLGCRLAIQHFWAPHRRQSWSPGRLAPQLRLVVTQTGSSARRNSPQTNLPSTLQQGGQDQQGHEAWLESNRALTEWRGPLSAEFEPATPPLEALETAAQ